MNNTTTKAVIRQDKLDELKKSLPADKHSKLDDVVESMHEVVNIIEHSGRRQTTQHYYGDYLPLVIDKTNYVLLKIAGAGPGCDWAARINGVL